MSGGRFNNSGYIYFHVDQFADELEILIENNKKVDEYGYASLYSEEVIIMLREQIQYMRKMAKTMKAIDYLYSGDHGEESFVREMIRISKDE